MAKPKRAARATPKFATLDASSEATTTQPEARATPSGTSRSDQPDAQHRPRRPRFTEDQVAEALKAAGGIFSGAARYLAEKYKRPCSRPAVHNYVKNSWRLQRIIDTVDEMRGDYAETLLWAHIEAGSERSLHFYMSTKLKHRGYARGVEVTGKGGGPIKTQAQPFDLSSLSGDELEALAQLVDKVAPPQSVFTRGTRH